MWWRNNKRRKNFNLTGKVNKYWKLPENKKNSKKIKETVNIFFLHQNQNLCPKVLLMKKNIILIIRCIPKVLAAKTKKTIWAKKVRKLWKSFLEKSLFLTKFKVRTKKYSNLQKRNEIYLHKIKKHSNIKLIYIYF